MLIVTNKLNHFLVDSIKSSVCALEGLIGEVIVVLDRITLGDLQNFDSSIADVPIVRFLFSNEAGLVRNLNFGILNSQYEYIARLDADDIMIKSRLEKQKLVLDQNSDLVLVGGGLQLIDEYGNKLGVVKYPQDMNVARKFILNGFPPAHPAVTFRKSRVIDLGMYRENYPYVEDLDLWLRMIKIGGVTNLNSPVTKYRLHENQVSKAKRLEQRSATLQLMKDQHASSKRSLVIRKFLVLRTELQIRIVSKGILNPANKRVSRRVLLGILFPGLYITRFWTNLRLNVRVSN